MSNQGVQGPVASTEREMLPILVGVAVGVLYVASVVTVVIGLLRFTREYLQRLPAVESSPGGLLARLLLRR